LPDLLFPGNPFGRSGFTESGGDDDAARSALPPARFENRRRLLRSHDDHDKVQFPRDILHSPVDFQPGDFAPFGVDGEDLALESHGLQG